MISVQELKKMKLHESVPLCIETTSGSINNRPIGRIIRVPHGWLYEIFGPNHTPSTTTFIQDS